MAQRRQHRVQPPQQLCFFCFACILKHSPSNAPHCCRHRTDMPPSFWFFLTTAPSAKAASGEGSREPPLLYALLAALEAFFSKRLVMNFFLVAALFSTPFADMRRCEFTQASCMPLSTAAKACGDASVDNAKPLSCATARYVIINQFTLARSRL